MISSKLTQLLADGPTRCSRCCQQWSSTMIEASQNKPAGLHDDPVSFVIRSDLPSCPEYWTRFIKLLTAPIQNNRGLERTFIWTGFNGLYQNLMITRLLSASRLRLVAPLYHLSRWKDSVAIATWQSAPSSTQSYMSSAPLQRSQGYRFSKEKENKVYDGQVNFKKFMIQPGLKVDKSMFIQEVLRNGWRNVFFTRPRGWGKSLNLSMLKYFFSIPIDQKGKITEGMYRPLFEGGLFTDESGHKFELDPLLISKETQIMRDQQGKYPVIFLDLSMEKSTHIKFKIEFARRIMNVYEEKYYLLQPPSEEGLVSFYHPSWSQFIFCLRLGVNWSIFIVETFAKKV